LKPYWFLGKLKALGWAISIQLFHNTISEGWNNTLETITFGMKASLLI
jgi:hypothetical protein